MRLVGMYFYLLLLNCVSSESEVPIISHKINISVQSLFYETEFDDYYGRKSVAYLLKLKNNILNEDPDVRVNYANLSIDLLSDFPLPCANFEQMDHNVSLFQANLMGPIWSWNFQNLHPRVKAPGSGKGEDACNSSLLSICEGATFGDLVPITQEILLLGYSCQSTRSSTNLQVNIGPVLNYYFAGGNQFYENVKMSYLVFSLVLDEHLLQPTFINNTKRHPIKAIQMNGLVINMEYTVDSK